MYFNLNRRAFFAVTALCLTSLTALEATAAADVLPSTIAGKGELAIGLESTYPPFNFQDESGNLVGFEVDFANDLCKRLGLTPRYVPTQFDGILAALASGRLDVVINQITITPERQKNYDFSVPYTITKIQMVTRKELAAELTAPEKLSGRTVGAVLGTNFEQWVRANVPDADVKTYDLDATMYRDLKAGRIDVALNDTMVAASLIKKADSGFVTAGEPFAPQEQAVAMRKEPALKAAIDKAIEEMKADGTLTAMSIKWLGVDVSK